MSDPTLDDVQAKVERAAEATGDDELSLLRSAREDVHDLRRADVDDDRLDELESKVDRRLSQLDIPNSYGGSVGAAMNPDEDDAP